MSRISTFVSTARMFPFDALSDPCLQFGKCFRLGRLGEQGLANFFGSVPGGSAHDVMPGFFVPFQHGSRCEAKFSPYLGGYGYLSLDGQF